MNTGLFIFIVAVVIVVIAFWVLWDRAKKDVESAVSKVKIYGEENKTFLQYPSLSWQNPLEPSLSQFLFATSWNATSAKLTKRQVPSPQGFDIVKEIKPNYSSLPELETYAVFMHNSVDGVSVISFGGSETATDWITDITYDQVEPTELSLGDSSIRCHEGFYKTYLSIRSQLQELLGAYHGKLYLTGYSLGGGLCVQAALDFAKDANLAYVATFASPRSVNVEGASYLKSIGKFYRFSNSEDVVPTLPLPLTPSIWDPEKIFYYEQIGTNIEFTSNLKNIVQNHSTAYLNFVFSQ